MFAIEGFAFGAELRLRQGPLPGAAAGRLAGAHARDAGAVDDVPGGVQFTVTQTFEREGGDKPVCVAESLARFYTGG